MKNAVIGLALLLLALGPGCIRPIADNRTISAPGDYSFTTMHGGIEREYVMHVPPSYRNSTPTPVVIFLHGGLGGDDRAEALGLNANSDKYGFILLAPAGTSAFSSNELRTWNAGAWDNSSCCGYAYKKNVDDVGFISQMIDETEARVNVDAKRVYATGFSNGGGLTYRLACELSNRIAAAAASSPAGLEGNCSPSRPISIMHIHGTADPCVPFNGGKSQCASGTNWPPAQQDVDFWLGQDRCGASGTVAYQNGNATCTSYACAQGTEVEFCKVEGMGHAWPAGNYYTPKSANSISRDISFDQIWEFFQRNPME